LIGGDGARRREDPNVIVLVDGYAMDISRDPSIRKLLGPGGVEPVDGRVLGVCGVWGQAEDAEEAQAEEPKAREAA